jgi:hydrogenase maturation protease
MSNLPDKKIAVIGLGNTLRRDDGIGIAILESLLNFHKEEKADYLNFDIAGFDLLHRIQRYDKVLLIDAINGGLNPGELKILDTSAAPKPHPLGRRKPKPLSINPGQGRGIDLDRIEYDLNDAFSSSHELGLKDLFALTKKLDIKTKIYLAGIQAKDTSYGEGLSEDLEGKKKEITDAIRKFISRNL